MTDQIARSSERGERRPEAAGWSSHCPDSGPTTIVNKIAGKNAVSIRTFPKSAGLYRMPPLKVVHVSCAGRHVNCGSLWREFVSRDTPEPRNIYIHRAGSATCGLMVMLLAERKVPIGRHPSWTQIAMSRITSVSMMRHILVSRAILEALAVGGESEHILNGDILDSSKKRIRQT